MKATLKTDVLIIGAGPTGLSVACQLLRYGIHFVIKSNGLCSQSKTNFTRIERDFHNSSVATFVVCMCPSCCLLATPLRGVQKANQGGLSCAILIAC